MKRKMTEEELLEDVILFFKTTYAGIQEEYFDILQEHKIKYFAGVKVTDEEDREKLEFEQLLSTWGDQTSEIIRNKIVCISILDTLYYEIQENTGLTSVRRNFLKYLKEEINVRSEVYAENGLAF